MPRTRKTKTDSPKNSVAVKKKVVKKAPPKPRKKRKTNYLNNADLLAEVIKSKKQDNVMTPKLAKMLTMLTSNYSKKIIFASYTYNEDMQAYAMMMLVRTWFKFDENRFNNPFAFYTQCIKSSFIQYLNQEKRQRLIKDEILVKKGLTPSFNYQLEYEARKTIEDEECHDQKLATVAEINSEKERDNEDTFLSY